MTRPRYDWQDANVRHAQALRDLDAYAWAPRRLNFTANILSGLAMALLMVVIAVWENWL